MKIRTVPFFPLSEFNECSFPSVSGRVKSTIVDPMAGGAGTSLPWARAFPAAAIANGVASISARARNFFITVTPLRLLEMERRKRKISSQPGGWQAREWLPATDALIQKAGSDPRNYTK